MAFYNIAGLKVNMDLNYSLLADKAKPYLVSKENCPDADISVKVSKERLDLCATEQMGEKYMPEYEYVLAGSDFYYKLLDFCGMMVHSSAVAVDGYAYLFSADSGVGKSTHTALWLKLLGDAAYILNDDKPAVRIIDDKVFAYGTPFSGKNDINQNKCVPLGAICFIERAEQNSIKKLTAAEALPLMLKQTQRKPDKQIMERLLSVLDAILSRVNVYKLCCNMDISAAQLAYDTMKVTE